MVFTIVLKVKDLFNGKVLPDIGVEDKGVAFYNAVFRSDDRDLVKLSFNKKIDTVEANFIEPAEEVPSSFLKESMKATYAKLDMHDKEIYIYVYKIYVATPIESGNTFVGYCRRMGPHSEQDVPIASVDAINPTRFDGDAKEAIITRVDPTKYKSYEALDCLRTSPMNPLSPRWFTQKAFYGSSHVTGSNALQFIDYKDIIKNFFGPHKCSKFLTVVELVKTFATILHRGIVYKSDYRFELPNTLDDFGDASIETSTWGDCEDMAHFYMRTLRLLCDMYPYCCEKGSAMYELCTDFKKHYTPFVMICRIEVHGRLEYHSTVMILPTEGSGLKPISLEVTSPDKTYDLSIAEDLKEYKDWHISHYFLVDAQHVARMEGEIEDYTLEKFTKDCFNY